MTLGEPRIRDALSYRIGQELYQKGVLKYEPVDLSKILRKEPKKVIGTALSVLDDFIEKDRESEELRILLESEGKPPERMPYEKIEPYARDRYDNVVVPALKRALTNSSKPSEDFEAEFTKAVEGFKQTYLFEVIDGLFRKELDNRMDEVYPKKPYRIR